MKRLFGMLSTAALTAYWLLIGAWVVSRVITDRFRWSQYPWWTPTWALLVAAGVLLLLALLCRPSQRRRSRRPRWPARTAVLAIALVGAYFALVECRVYRLIGRPAIAEAAAAPGGLRVLYWNPSMNPKADVARNMNLVSSDLAIMANPTWVKPFGEMAERFGPGWFVMADQFVVLSRSRVLRWGATQLGLRGQHHEPSDRVVLNESPTGRLDPGRACWLELDTTTVLGRPIVVWVVDLPSDDRLSRWETTVTVAAVLRDWQGVAATPDGHGSILATEPMQGFPEPDVVIGDLNATRGSASLGRLAPGMHNAYDDGGAGYTATFPRVRPLVHIDHVLLAPWLHASDYRVIDPGVSRHRMQWSRIEPAPR